MPASIFLLDPTKTRAEQPFDVEVIIELLGKKVHAGVLGVQYPSGEKDLRLTRESLDDFLCKELPSKSISDNTFASMDDYVFKVVNRTGGSQEILNNLVFIENVPRLSTGVGTFVTYPDTRLVEAYHPYSREDKPLEHGGPDLLLTHSILIAATTHNKVVLMDPHSKISHKYMERAYDSMRMRGCESDTIEVITQANILEEMLRLSCHHETVNGLHDLVSLHKPVIVCPDAGARAKIDDVMKVQGFEGLPAVYASKKRDPATGRLSNFEVDLSPLGAEVDPYQDFLIVDDLIDGGGTFIGLAQEILKVYPKAHLHLAASYGLFTKGFAPLLAVFDSVHVGNIADPDLCPAITSPRFITMPWEGSRRVYNYGAFIGR